MTSSPLDRRSVLRLAALSVLAVGCRGADDDPTVMAASGAPATRSPTQSGAGEDLPAAAGYAPLAGEKLPNLKQVAADFVQALTTYVRGQRPEDLLAGASALLAPGFAADTALRAAAPLFTEQVAVGQIVYPQLSGLLPLGPGAQQAGVMVVVRQRLLTRGGSTTEVVRVCDVRLTVVQGQWRVSEIISAGGEPVERPTDLDPAVAAVLDDPRIELPDTCRWDVHAGGVSADLLSVLASAAAVAPVAVTVLRNGHPINVFGTPRISDHTQGRAVDLWRIGGAPVVGTGATVGPARTVLVAAAADRRTRATGSPVGSDLDGPGGRSFTDLVHHDHLHLAVGAVANG